MYPKVSETLLDAQLLRPGQIVNDIVYNPLETQLLQDARKRGCTVVQGHEMLILQGAAQFELWTGQPAPVHVMQAVVEARLRK